MNAAISKKVQRILNLDTTTVEFNNALESLDSFYVSDGKQNTIESRRSLMSNLEKETLLVENKLVSQLKVMHDAIDSLTNDVNELVAMSGDIDKQLQTTKQDSKSLLAETRQLQEEKMQLELKDGILTLFEENYMLTSGEEQVLSNPPESAEFFTALGNLTAKMSKTSQLLKTKSARLAVEVMDSLSFWEESAFAVLFRWTQRQLAALSTENPDIPALLPMAMEHICKRPALFDRVVEEAISLRKDSVEYALTMTVERNLRPLSLPWSDPNRFSADICAWLHQCIALEKEVCVLFTKKEVEENVRSEVEYMNSVFSATATSVLQYWQEAITACTESESAHACIQLSLLFRFYLQKFHHVPCMTDSLLVVCREAGTAASQALYALVSAIAQARPAQLYGICLNLAAEFGQIQRVMKTALVTPEADMLKLVYVTANLAAQRVEQVLADEDAATISTVSVNCLSTLYDAMDSVAPPVAAAEFEALESRLEAHCETLCQEEVSIQLKSLGLMDFVLAAQNEKDNTDAATTTQLDIIGSDGALTTALTAFYSSCMEVGTLSLPHCEAISSVTWRSKARSRTAELMLAAYTTLYRSLVDNPQMFEAFRYSPEEVGHLLK